MAAAVTPREQQVMAVLETRPRGLTFAEIARLIDATHKAACAAVYSLSRKGLVERADGGYPPRGGRSVGIWRVTDGRMKWTPRPDVAAAWIPRVAA